MQVIGLIGYVDKYDFAMNLAKAINVMDKSVLVVDATLDRKLKYIVPALNNMGRAYITQYSDIDFAVGFDSIRDVESYAGEQGVDINKYDFVIIDMDSARSYELFRTKGVDKKYFFIDTSVISIEKNKEIIKAMKVFDTEGDSELVMTKVLYKSYISRAADDYFDQKIKEYEVKWKEPDYEVPLDEQDRLADIDSQFSGSIETKKHSKLYMAILADLAAEIMGDVNAKKVLNQIKRRK